jgi:hypothetical protein
MLARCGNQEFKIPSGIFSDGRIPENIIPSDYKKKVSKHHSITSNRDLQFGKDKLSMRRNPTVKSR